MPRRKSRRLWLDYLAYLAVRLVVAFAQILTIEQSYALARFLAWAIYTVDARHRMVGIENLRLAFGDRYNEADCDRIVRGVYLHFCMMLMEILHTPRKIHLTNWREYVTLVGHEPILDRLMTGGPMILLTGHYGNWEMAGYLFGLFGYPTYSVARTLDNPYLDQFLRSFRERTGQKLIPKAGGYDQILEVLLSGRTLSMLADQDAGQRGMFVDFFGRPASTHKAIALLAIEHQAPVVVGVARRVGPGFRYEIRCADVIEPAEFTGSADDARILTQRYTTALEALIRQDPTQYLWLHRRWKHQPQPRKTRVAHL
jgi:KDO2-lipid IV(A) lauroyltransferase